MPHISIEYSANLDDIVDVGGLCETLRVAGIETGVFPDARHSRSRLSRNPLCDRRR